jgi:hypothetical protein
LFFSYDFFELFGKVGQVGINGKFPIRVFKINRFAIAPPGGKKAVDPSGFAGIDLQTGFFSGLDVDAGMEMEIPVVCENRGKLPVLFQREKVVFLSKGKSGKD